MAGFWRKCRIVVRCLRIGLWVLLLAMLGALLWFNRVGLPDFLKTQLVAALREQGVELEFSRMRLSLVRGLVADNVRAGQPGPDNGPSFTARLVQLELDYPALWHRRLALDGLVLRDGFFSLPVSSTNTLSFTNLQAELRFGVNDTWSFDQLHADFAGVRIGISGEVAHAREARQWKLFGTGGPREDHGPAAASLKNFSDVLRQIHFQGDPKLLLKISGDARDVHSIVIQLDADGEGVRTPWFTAKDFQASARLTATADAPTNGITAAGFWKNLQPFRMAWSARLGMLRSPKLDADALACEGVWSAPKLAVTNLSARLGGGRLDAGATLDVPSRRVEFNGASSFDLHAISRLLPQNVQKELASVSWTQPPRLKADGSLRLPPWTNFAAAYDPALSFRGEVAFTNTLARGVKLDRVQARFRYFDQIWELTDFALKQGRTDLRLSGQESEATKNFRFLLSGKIDAASAQPFLPATHAAKFFEYVTLHEPLELTLDMTGNLRKLETLTATGRVALADFAIRSTTVDRVAADLTYSNLTAVFLRPQLTRAGGAETFTAEKLTLDIAGQRLFFTNGLGHADPMAVGHAIGPKTAAAMAPYQFLGIPTAHVNGCVPLKQEDGDLVLDDADIRFDIEGTTPFRWMKFETPAITGTIHWWKNFIILTNAVSECYGGEARGWGVFDVKTPGPGTDFSFSVTGTNVDLNHMGRALWSPTNRLEGALSGTIHLTQANSSDWRTWQGHGDVLLRDGLLWNVPMFAFMSPVLNTVVPGLGNSRATDAAAPFTMTNGVIATDSLVIHAQMMQLDYSGTVDLEENVNARVTARLLRNMPVIGPIVTTALWPVSKLFECHVTGKLGDPVVKPIYILPKIILMPLRPIRTLEELFTPATKSNASVTNSPDASGPDAK